jgi:streptomycin 6-kinase
LWTDSRIQAAIEKWSLTVVDVLTGGKQAFVASVRTSADTAAVLKVAPLGPEFGQQIRVLEAAQGRGYVTVHEYDPTLHAALLEPLGPSLAGSASLEQSLEVLASMLTVAWEVPLAVGAPLDKAGELGRIIDDLWPQHGWPAPAELRDRALALAAHRPSSGPVVCHGDPHEHTALRRGDGFVFVDPDGFIAPREYDLGVVMRGWPEVVLAAAEPGRLVYDWAARLAGATGADAGEIWAWAFIERVSSGLYLRHRGFEAEGRAFLASAERLL